MQTVLPRSQQPCGVSKPASHTPSSRNCQLWCRTRSLAAQGTLFKYSGCHTQSPLHTTVRLQRASSSRTQIIRQAADGLLDPTIASAAGTFAVLCATILFTLYLGQQQRTAQLEKEVLQLQKAASERQTELEALKTVVLADQKIRSDLDMYKRRYDQAEKDIMKLERALEIKDGQLESFMVVAKRQIKLLEDRVKELQKMD